MLVFLSFLVGSSLSCEYFILFCNGSEKQDKTLSLTYNLGKDNNSETDMFLALKLFLWVFYIAVQPSQLVQFFTHFVQRRPDKWECFRLCLSPSEVMCQKCPTIFSHNSIRLALSYTFSYLMSVLRVPSYIC